MSSSMVLSGSNHSTENINQNIQNLTRINNFYCLASTCSSNSTKQYSSFNSWFGHFVSNWNRFDEPTKIQWTSIDRDEGRILNAFFEVEKRWFCSICSISYLSKNKC